MRSDTGLDRDAWVAAPVQPTMALPAFELHHALNCLAIDENALAAQLRPDDAISEVRFLSDDMLDALCQDFIEFHHPFLRMVIC
jgi:hypothetical protein